MVVQHKNKTHMSLKKMVSKKKSSLKRKHHKGGSPASNLVNEEGKAQHQVTHDFVTSPRIREGPMKGGTPDTNHVIEEVKAHPHVQNDFVTSPRIHEGPMKGGSPATNHVNEEVKSHNNVNHDFVTSRRIREELMKGGSTASDMVMSNLNADHKTNSFVGDKPVKGNMNSLNLYKPSGGARKSKGKSRKSKGKGKSRKSKGKSRKSKGKSRKVHKMKGGGSDWISSQYSLGPSNNPEMSSEDVAKFSQTEVGSRADYMNPPNLALAGSGSPMSDFEDANINKVGAPLI